VADPGGAAADLETPASTDVQRAARAWLAPVALGLVALAGCAYLGVENPNDPGSLLPRCPTKMLTGLDCPACGGLRCVRALTTGQWSAAVHANLFLLVLFPIAVVVWLRWLVAAATGASYRPALSKRASFALLVVAVLWMVVRNLPFWPLHPLA
jgi:Protein of unknown function (DUF2752)